jgi:hypothetical protein
MRFRCSVLSTLAENRGELKGRMPCPVLEGMTLRGRTNIGGLVTLTPVRVPGANHCCLCK